MLGVQPHEFCRLPLQSLEDDHYISHLQVGENEYHAVGKDNHKKQFWDVWVFLFLFLFSKVNEDGKD